MKKLFRRASTGMWENKKDKDGNNATSPGGTPDKDKPSPRDSNKDPFATPTQPTNAATSQKAATIPTPTSNNMSAPVNPGIAASEPRRASMPVTAAGGGGSTGPTDANAAANAYRQAWHEQQQQNLQQQQQQSQQPQVSSVRSGPVEETKADNYQNGSTTMRPGFAQQPTQQQQPQQQTVAPQSQPTNQPPINGSLTLDSLAPQPDYVFYPKSTYAFVASPLKRERINRNAKGTANKNQISDAPAEDAGVDWASLPWRMMAPIIPIDITSLLLSDDSANEDKNQSEPEYEYVIPTIPVLPRSERKRKEGLSLNKLPNLPPIPSGADGPSFDPDLRLEDFNNRRQQLQEMQYQQYKLQQQSNGYASNGTGSTAPSSSVAAPAQALQQQQQQQQQQPQRQAQSQAQRYQYGDDEDDLSPVPIASKNSNVPAQVAEKERPSSANMNKVSFALPNDQKPAPSLGIAPAQSFYAAPGPSSGQSFYAGPSSGQSFYAGPSTTTQQQYPEQGGISVPSNTPASTRASIAPAPVPAPAAQTPVAPPSVPFPSAVPATPVVAQPVSTPQVSSNAGTAVASTTQTLDVNVVIPENTPGVGFGFSFKPVVQSGKSTDIARCIVTKFKDTEFNGQPVPNPSITAGLRVDDVIEAINGQKASTTQQLLEYIKGSGTRMVLTVVRRVNN
jgi:hypothetical protein